MTQISVRITLHTRTMVKVVTSTRRSHPVTVMVHLYDARFRRTTLPRTFVTRNVTLTRPAGPPIRTLNKAPSLLRRRIRMKFTCTFFTSDACGWLRACLLLTMNILFLYRLRDILMRNHGQVCLISTVLIMRKRPLMILFRNVMRKEQVCSGSVVITRFSHVRDTLILALRNWKVNAVTVVRIG